MKKSNVFLVVLAALMLVLAACGGDAGSDKDATDGKDTNQEVAENDATDDKVYTPEDIKDTDVCEVCAMSVPDNQHATQIILKNEKSLKFDDLGCLHEWKDENGEDDIGAEFVRDFHTEEWIEIKDATFVYDEEIETPMAYGVISFKNADEAEAYIDEHGKGVVMDAAALASHEWKMNMDMMNHDGHDHGDDDGHDHHGDHDEHGDHDDHDEE